MEFSKELLALASEAERELSDIFARIDGISFVAADVNKDGNVDVFDYIAIRKSILSGEAI